jgi:hypothetical protein
MPKKPKPENQESLQLRKLLIDHSYRHLWEIKGPNKSTLDAWWGTRGLLIVQSWVDRGVDIYHSAGVPSKWDEIPSWLASKTT